MNNRQSLIAAALTTLLAVGVSTANASEEAKEKCFGIAKAGQNDCASTNGSHSCAGQSKKDKDAGEWKYVAKGTCEKLGGKTSATK